jgi:hypothetical protein
MAGVTDPRKRKSLLPKAKISLNPMSPSLRIFEVAKCRSGVSPDIEENSLAFGLLESGSLAPGLALIGCRRVRSAPDMEKFIGSWPVFSKSPREAQGGAPEGGRAPRDFSRAASLSPERVLKL